MAAITGVSCKGDSEWAKLKVKMLLEKWELDYHQTLKYVTYWKWCLFVGVGFLSTQETFLPFSFHNTQYLESFGGMCYRSYSLKVRFKIILNIDQLLLYPKVKKSLTWMSVSILFLFAGKLCSFWHKLYLNACRFPKFKFAVCISVLCWSLSGLC